MKVKKSINPVLASRLKLWTCFILFAGLTIGSIKITQKENNIDDIEVKLVKEPIQNDEEYIESMAEPTDENISRVYNVSDSNFKTNFINFNWDAIVAGLLEFETYFEKPHLNRGETRYTYGPGMTWVYVDGKQYPCTGKYKVMADNFSSEQIWDQVRQHCLRKNELMDRIQSALKKNGITEISTEQMLGLFFAAYQTPSGVDIIIQRLKKAGGDEQKMIDAFAAGPEINKKWRRGTNKRRWWCAMIYTGKITINDILNMDMDAFASVEINRIQNSGHFMYDDSTICYALDMNNPNTETVQDFIDSDNKTLAFQDNKRVGFYKGIENIKKLNKRNNPVFVHYDDGNAIG